MEEFIILVKEVNIMCESLTTGTMQSTLIHHTLGLHICVKKHGKKIQTEIEIN